MNLPGLCSWVVFKRLATGHPSSEIPGDTERQRSVILGYLEGGVRPNKTEGPNLFGRGYM